MLDRGLQPIHFGRPGALMQLPWARASYRAAYDRRVGEFTTGSGIARVGKLPVGKRRIELTWKALNYETSAILEAFTAGHMGVGPWALLTPARLNLLTANQSAVTSLLNSTSGFTTLGGTSGVLSSNSTATHIHRLGAPRSLRWQWSTGPIASPILNLDSVYSSWFGIPVTPNTDYTFSGWVKPDGDASMSLAFRNLWRDAAGGSVGTEATSGDIAITGWQRITCSATSPSTAVYASPRLVAVGGTITQPASFYIDELQFEVGSVATAWTPGTGLYPVEIVEDSEDVPWDAMWRTSSSVTLKEVA